MVQGSVDRRRFLTGAAGLAVSGAALAACGGKAPSSPATGASENAVTTSAAATGATTLSPGQRTPSKAGPGSPLPTWAPYTGVKADLAAADHGVPAGFYHYPANPPAFVDHPLGRGGDITFLLQANSTNPLSTNKWWQQLNSAVNANLKLIGIPSADYTQKFQVTIAGNDLPDVAMVVTVANLPDVLENEFADLTEYLSGDQIKEYPGLASIPTATWQQICMLNGRIWGVAQPRPASGQVINTRGDLLKGFGVGGNSPTIDSGEAFLELCQQLTDAKRGKYALGQQPNANVLAVVLEMFGAPNNWKQEDGAFTSVFESDEMKHALDQVTRMWKAGYIHPDAFASPGQYFTWWSAGTTALALEAISSWSINAVQHPEWDIGSIVAPKWGGGGPADKILGIPGYHLVGLKKAAPDRIREILQILDFFAAPFGTKEYLTMNYGVPEWDYTLKQGDPVVSAKETTAEWQKAWGYCAGQAYAAIYIPGDTDMVKAEHDYLSTVLPTGVPDPTWGLYSATALTAGVAAGKTLSDAQADIIQGRKSLTEWDGLVKGWAHAAGDQMRKEYEQAFADQVGG